VPVSAADVINPAIDHTAGQLFRPFRLGQWTRLAVTGILAGELGSMGGCSFQIPSLPRTNPNSQDFLAQLIPPQSVLIVVAIVILVLAGVALLIGLMYVSSVMRFVLFDSVVARECHIRRFWSNRRRPGFRYFVWQLLFTAAMTAVFVLIAGAGAAVVFGFGWFRNPREHLIALILCGVVFFIVFIAFVVTALVIAVLTKDFVVPQMALEDISAIEGWRRLWANDEHREGPLRGIRGNEDSPVHRRRDWRRNRGLHRHSGASGSHGRSRSRSVPWREGSWACLERVYDIGCGCCR